MQYGQEILIITFKYANFLFPNISSLGNHVETYQEYYPMQWILLIRIVYIDKVIQML